MVLVLVLDAVSSSTSTSASTANAEYEYEKPEKTPIETPKHANSATRARNRIEATVKEYLLGCDRLGVYRTQIQAVADCRGAEYDMSAR